MYGPWLALALLLTGCAIEQPPVPMAEPPGMSCPVEVRQERVEVLRMVQEYPVVYQGRGVQKHTQGDKDWYRQAIVQPGEGKRQQGNVELTYAWHPGKVYTVTLTKSHGTGIMLPAGETLLQGLYLSKEDYEVQVARVGEREQGYESLLIRPLLDKGEQYAYLLLTSGKVVHLRLLVGATGMQVVRFTHEGA